MDVPGGRGEGVGVGAGAGAFKQHKQFRKMALFTFCRLLLSAS